jgi:hypothetical protein
MALVAVALLALILFNTADLCAAVIPLPHATEHSCCPHPATVPEHCAKLGCSVADPALLVKAQIVTSPAVIAGHAVTEDAPLAVLSRVIAPSVPMATLDRAVSFHQLLI